MGKKRPSAIPEVTDTYKEFIELNPAFGGDATEDLDPRAIADLEGVFYKGPHRKETHEQQLEFI